MRSPDMSTAERESLAHRIANDREEGFSGAALRAKYGEWLTGPNRRVLLRESGRDDLIGASYVTFRDGQPRKGFARAQAHEHGPFVWAALHHPTRRWDRLGRPYLREGGAGAQARSRLGDASLTHGVSQSPGRPQAAPRPLTRLPDGRDTAATRVGRATSE